MTLWTLLFIYRKIRKVFKYLFLLWECSSMFKDYNKYLFISLKVYLFVLIILFILKLVGLDYFGINLNNPTIVRINDIIVNYHFENIYYAFTLYIYTYIILSISNCDNSKRMRIYSIFILVLSVGLKVAEKYMTNFALIFVIELVFLLLACLLYNKFKNAKKVLINSVLIIIINLLFQVLSIYLRNIHFDINLPFVVNMVLDFDYLIMLIILYKYIFLNGGDIRCVMEAGSSLLKKINLKKSLQRLQKNYQSNLEAFKKKNKEEKLTIIIFSILSFIWNCLTLVVVFVMAMINDTAIECIFIITSFWLSKRSFGKAFHFDSMIVCFIVSNLSYFILNRITTPLGISIFIPILLGVGLSYVTSKFVKKVYKPLYRGMPIDLFEDTILQVVDKDSDKYKICYEFYIDKKSDLSLSYKYNYSVAGIRKIKDRINNKIKRL